MEFTLIKYHNNVTDEELLADLKKVATILKKTPTMDEYNEYGSYECSAFRRHFTTWNNALSLVGYEPNNQFWSEKELYKNIYNVWVTKGKQPTRRDMNDKELSIISSGAYLRYFSSWTNALERFVEWVNEKEDDNSIINDTSNEKDAHKTPRDVNLRLRFLVMKRDNFKCCVCGRSPASFSELNLHVDHIIPWSKGGETVIDNLQTLCQDCNLGKSDL